MRRRRLAIAFAATLMLAQSVEIGARSAVPVLSAADRAALAGSSPAGPAARPDPSPASRAQLGSVSPSEITFTGRLAQQASAAQSVMIFHNSDTSAGTVTVSIRDRATGAELGEWESPSIPPGATVKFDSRDLNSSVPGNFIPAETYSITLGTSLTGSFQHLLLRPSSETLTNLTTCDSGVTTDPTRLIAVSAARPNDPLRNRVVVHNTGPVTANATLTIYDADDGTRLGTYAVAGIPPGGFVINTVAQIEADAGIPNGSSLYVVRANPGLPGYLQHIVGVQGQFGTDLTASCALNTAPSTAPPPVSRVALHSTLRDTARSILRFYNSGGPADATVTVDLRDEITGAFLGSWTSPAIPLGVMKEFPIATIEADATPNTFTIPAHYSASIRSGFQGSVQHLILDRTDGALSNFSTCNAGTSAEMARLAGVFSTRAVDLESAVVVHNLGASATTVALDVYDAATGALAGTYTTPSVAARGLLVVPVATLESGAAIAPTPLQQRWVVQTSGTFTGFVQHLLHNVRANAMTDLTATCALRVSPTAPAANYYVAPNGDDSWSGTLAEPNADGTDGPFLTFGAAKAAVAALPKTAEIVVQFRAGHHYEAPSVLMQTAEGGTSATTRVVYREYPGEQPVISGGKRVDGWVNVSGDRWEATLPADTVNFESLFYNDVRRPRPRLGGGPVGTYLRIAQPVSVSVGETNCPSDLNGDGVVESPPYTCFDRFTYQGTDLDAAATWTNLAPAAGNRCGQTAGSAALKGDIQMIVFLKYSAARMRIECIDTASKTVFLTGVTAAAPFEPGTNSPIAGARYLVENVKDALTEPGQWFLDRSVSPWKLVYLAHEAEDPNADTVIIPQQTHVLRASFVRHTTFQGLTFAHDNYVVPDAGESGNETFRFITPAVSFTNSNNITFDGVSVARTSGMGLWFTVCLLDPGPVVAAGNPTWCPTGGYSLTPLVANNIIRNSAFYDLGASAIGVGFQQRLSDTDANVPQEFTIENNVIAGYGRVLPNAFGVYQGTANNITYTHNDVYDGYRAAFHICPCNRNFRGTDSDGAYNNVISYNHVHDLMQGVMNDAGAIRIMSGYFGFQPAGNRIVNNVIHDINDASAVGDADGYGGDGIYIDDVTSNIEVAYNLVYRVSRAALNITMNADVQNVPNDIHDNVFAYARLAMIQNNRPYPNGTVPSPAVKVFDAKDNIFYFTRQGNPSDASGPDFYVQGGCTYAGGYDFEEFQLREHNLYWRTDSAFATDANAFREQPVQGSVIGDPAKDINTICNPPIPGTHDFMDFAEWTDVTTGLGQDIGSEVHDPGFANPVYPHDDFSLPAGSYGAGFVDTSADKYEPQRAGRTSATFTPPPVPATFPTATFDPAIDY